MSKNNKFSFFRMIGKYLKKAFIKDDIFGLAAEMAFYLLTAFFPFIILLFILVTNLSYRMQSLLFNLIHALPTQTETILMNMLLNLTSSIPIIITASVFAMWCSSNVINTLKKALNRFYGVKETRGFIQTRLMCIAFAILIIVMIVLSFALIIFGEGTGFLLRYTDFFWISGSVNLWDLWRYLAIALVFFFAISIMFKVLPNKKVKLYKLFGGSALTTAAWCVTSWVFSFYVNNFSRYHLIYSSLAGIVILITWIYMSVFVILMGGELNAFWYRTRKAKRLRKIREEKEASD